MRWCTPSGCLYRLVYLLNNSKRNLHDAHNAICKLKTGEGPVQGERAGVRLQEARRETSVVISVFNLTDMHAHEIARRMHKLDTKVTLACPTIFNSPP